MRQLLLCIALLACLVVAQDPPQGWMGYAMAKCPKGTHLTHMEAKWKVGATPMPSNAFYSPWFGSDTSDNMNLIQPVNPWLGNQWAFYTEYFQWSPVQNQNSGQESASAGDQLHGELHYLGNQQYRLTQTDVTNHKNSTMVINVQKDSLGQYKKYTILYVVYEKVWQCWQYPPDGKVTFSDIEVYCSGQKITPAWTTHFVDDACDNRAHVISPSEIQITWNTKGKNPTKEQMENNYKSKKMPFGKLE